MQPLVVGRTTGVLRVPAPSLWRAPVYNSQSTLKKQDNSRSGGKLGRLPPRSRPSVQGHPSDSSLSTQHPEARPPDSRNMQVLVIPMPQGTRHVWVGPG